ncbi:MAG: hypothetical protein K2P30_00465, partial [Lachnospiraceae bacterium]|nr:hypothetical protein [Lachnospiraceae bacterium]
MEDLSYSFPSPHFYLGGFEFSVMVYTFRNVYAPKMDGIKLEQDGDTLLAKCQGLIWAGGQMEIPGNVTVKACVCEQGILVEASAFLEEVSEDIRSIKLVIHGLSEGKIINLTDARPKTIPEEGLILKYPEGWRDVGTPLVIMKTESGRLIYFQSLDNMVRDKWFVFVPSEYGINVELIFEEKATEMTNCIQSPSWKIGYGKSLEEIYEPHRLHVEKSYGLSPWETRTDVPEWARDISLIASIHCQHWTGYIFNDYAEVLENLKKICSQIEGRRVLAYLPGWEGRYYWKYGNYTPDERMGGEEGFRKLCEGAKKLGVHIMPMFGINLVGTHFDGYEQWGAPSEFRGPAGSVYGGSVDWDGSRHYDHNSNRNLNPAAPRWQNRLYGQVTGLMEKYGFDAAFFDISAVWMNDPNHYLYDGIRKLMNRFKQYNPDMLLA